MANPENAAENTYDLASSEHRTGGGVELDSASGGGDVSESFSVKEASEEVRILVQNATGNYSVDLNFDNTSLSLQSGASTQLKTSEDIFSNSTVEVTITDESGVSNTVDYDILLI